MQIRAYWNSQRRQWAVVRVGSRRVAFYADALTLTDVTYHAGLKGQHRVCKSGHKNRHNYVEGKLASFSPVNQRVRDRVGAYHGGECPVGYEPTFSMDTEYRLTHKPYTPVTHSRLAELTSFGTIYKEWDHA